MNFEKYQVFLIEAGEIINLHDDDTAEELGHVGTLFVERASDVFFGKANGFWIVMLSNSATNGQHIGQVIGEGFTRRDDAIEFEKRWISKHILNGEPWDGKIYDDRDRPAESA